MSFNLSVPGVEESTNSSDFAMVLPTGEELKKEAEEATKAEDKEIIETFEKCEKGGKTKFITGGHHT